MPRGSRQVGQHAPRAGVKYGEPQQLFVVEHARRRTDDPRRAFDPSTSGDLVAHPVPVHAVLVELAARHHPGLVSDEGCELVVHADTVPV